MYPSLPFGPLSLPTGPILAILAVFLGLETAGRFGRRMGLRPDDVWNTGMLAILAGLIVARLWNVIQFTYVYAAEPLLIFSLRPSGFALWPGVIAAFVAAYAYLIRRSLDPLKMAAAFAVGLLMAAGVLSLADFLTGAVTGLPTDLPWATWYYGELQHPVGIYQAIGCAIALAIVWAISDPARPGRTVLLAGLGFGLVHLIADGFMADATTIGPFRLSQVAGLVLALICAGLLAYTSRRRFERSAPEPAPANANPD